MSYDNYDIKTSLGQIKSMSEFFPYPVWIADSGGKICFCNQHFYNILDRVAENTLGLEWTELVHPNDKGQEGESWGVALKDKATKYDNVCRVLVNGSYKYFKNDAKRLILEGNTEIWIGSLVEKETLANVKEDTFPNQEILQAVFNILPEMDAFIFDHDYRYIQAGGVLMLDAGFSPSDFIGKTAYEVLGDWFRDEIEICYRKALAGTKNNKGVTYGGKHFKIYTAPLYDEQGKVMAGIAVSHEITDLVKASRDLNEKNRQLKKLNNELDHFVYCTSHNLRSPLTSVLGLVKLIEMEGHSEIVGEYLGMVTSSINKLDLTIEDIIDYSRNNHSAVNISPVYFSDFIHGIWESLRYSNKAKEQRLVLDIPANFVLHSDKVRLKTIFHNLLSNSLKYAHPTRKEDVVIITLKEEGHYKIVTVKDNGIGIAPDVLPHIFKMFYRGTVERSGSGIGLYIVKEAVRKLSAEIEVSSVVGEGTVFTIKFPLPTVS